MKQFKLVLGILAIFAGNTHASLIHLGAKLSSTQMVQIQLLKGVHPSLRDKHGNTPLHYAKTPAIVSMLLRHDADPNVKNNDGLTPLHLLPLKASIKKQVDRVASVFSTIIRGFFGALGSGRHGGGPLPQAEWAKGAFENIGNLLLRGGAKPNIQDNGGNTPLHDAVRFGRLSLVSKLLKHGANPNAKNKEGLTPLHSSVGLIGTPIMRNITLGLATAAVPGYVEFLSSHSAAIDADDRMRQSANWAWKTWDRSKRNLLKVSEKATGLQRMDAITAGGFARDGTYQQVMMEGQKAGALGGNELVILQRAAAAQADDAMQLAGMNVILGETETEAARQALRSYDELSTTIQKNIDEKALKGTKFIPKAVAVSAVVIASIILLVVTVNIFIRNHIVQKLIDAGADVNALDNLGNNPLHFIAAGKRFKLKERKMGIIAAHKLLDAGANYNATNKAGLTPYKIARKNYRLILAAVLKPSAAAKRQKRRAWFKEKVKGKFAQ